MKAAIFSVFLLMLISSCSARHDRVYVYENNDTKAYTTDRAIEFDVKHYKKYANTNVLVLNDSQSLIDTERSATINSLCLDFEMDCQNLNLSSFDSSEILNALENFNRYKGDKFLLMSPNKRLTAKYIGLVHMLEHNGTEESAKAIIKSIGVEDPDTVLSEIKSIKNQ